MIESWRLVHERYARTAFDGEGARRAGGRFNSVGTPVVYTADSLALAMLEVAVHLPSYRQLLERVAFPVRFEEGHVEDVGELPIDWRITPVPPFVQVVGDRWQRSGRSLVLRAPSVIVPRAFNYVINPEHPSFAEIEVGDPEPIEMDERLFK
jgi:RES domain-containing protein